MTPPTEKEDMMKGEKALSLIAQQLVYPISESERPMAFTANGASWTLYSTNGAG